MNQTKALKNQSFDADKWQKLYYRHQQQYIRHRLSAIRLLHRGSSRLEVCEQVGCSYDTLTSWLRKYLQGGLEALASPIKHQKPSRLTSEQQQQLKEIILTQLPIDYGIERQMWTGAIISKVIAQRFKVQLKDSRIYELRSHVRIIVSARPSRLCQRQSQSTKRVDRYSKKNFDRNQQSLRRFACQRQSADSSPQRIAFFDS